MIEDIKAALRELESEDGRLLPADVVNAARDEDSVLHSHFQWNDTIAGEKYRLSQARQLIRLVRVDVIVHEIPLNVVSYLRDPDSEAHSAGYRSVVALRTEVDSARAAIIAEMSRVASAVRRARLVAAVLGVDGDIEAISALAAAVTERVSTPPPPPEAPPV
jgi:hypothetical protein